MKPIELCIRYTAQLAKPEDVKRLADKLWLARLRVGPLTSTPRKDVLYRANVYSLNLTRKVK